jgi:hypothetical protein
MLQLVILRHPLFSLLPGQGNAGRGRWEDGQGLALEHRERAARQGGSGYYPSLLCGEQWNPIFIAFCGRHAHAQHFPSWVLSLFSSRLRSGWLFRAARQHHGPVPTSLGRHAGVE